MKVCIPANLSRYAITMTLCGREIPKKPIKEYSKRLKNDPEQVTARIEVVTCSDCLGLRLQQINKMTEAILKRAYDLGFQKVYKDGLIK